MRVRWAILATAAALTLAGRADAQVSKPPMPAPDRDAPTPQELLGGWDGARSQLHAQGLDVSLGYTGQIAADVAGGRRGGLDYAQQIEFHADLDWSKLTTLKGFSTHAILVNRAGRNAGTDYVGDNLFQPQSVYGGAGNVGVHLVELYAEQSLGGGRLDIAGGRLAVGEDFATSPLYCHFLNTAVCGYPHSLPSKIGFTVFPNSTWGGRLRVALGKSVYVEGGAYQVRPKAGGPSGLNWGGSGSTGAYLPLEMAFEPKLGPEKLSGHYKLGLTHDTSDYPDVLRDRAGGLDLLGESLPLRHKGRSSAYLLADQMVYRRGGPAEQGMVVLGGYVRSDADTSQLSRFGFLGVLGPSPLRSRKGDSLGLMISHAHISNALAKAQHLQAAAGLPLSMDAIGPQSSETIYEANYTYAVTAGLTVTPDIQYVVRPGAARVYPNATVLALQVKASF